MGTFVIAEAGVNHNGDPNRALAMVRAAAEAGADAIKFQTFRAEDLVCAEAPMAAYQSRNVEGARTQLDMLRQLELDDADFVRIAEECRKWGIEFMSTPFTLVAVRMLERLGMRFWKIASGEVTNTPLLEAVASVAPKVILSTGMCTPAEISDAVRTLTAGGMANADITLLHCTTAYPAPLDSVNLYAMDTLRELNPGGEVGYSDHTPGIAVSLAAVARGAKVVEKHFTLDRDLPGPDHKASLEPDGLALMVRKIREVELALGSPDKAVAEAERENIAVARKSIVAACDIAPGETFTTRNLVTKRPGDGLSPTHWHTLLGRKAKRHYITDQQIDITEIQ